MLLTPSPFILIFSFSSLELASAEVFLMKIMLGVSVNVGDYVVYSTEVNPQKHRLSSSRVKSKHITVYTSKSWRENEAFRKQA